MTQLAPSPLIHVHPGASRGPAGAFGGAPGRFFFPPCLGAAGFERLLALLLALFAEPDLFFLCLTEFALCLRTGLGFSGDSGLFCTFGLCKKRGV